MSVWKNREYRRETSINKYSIFKRVKKQWAHKKRHIGGSQGRVDQFLIVFEF